MNNDKDTLEDTLYLLTRGMIEESFNGKDSKIVISKMELYKFCIKLIKLMIKVDKI